jgi:putative ABC transport system permease protein
MPDWKAFVRERLAERADPYQDVVDEVAQHAESLFDRLRAEGATEAQALVAVEEELKGISALARAAGARAARRPRVAEPKAGRFRLVASFFADLGYGLRRLSARPGFSGIVIVTLALGIGANTAIFSVVNALLLTPLPFEDPTRLVMVWETSANNPRDAYIVSAPNWKDWKAQSTTLQDFSIWEVLSYNLSGEAEPEQVSGLRVSSGAFRMLGVSPHLGRTFSATEDQPGHRVVVISHALWKRRFAGDPTIVGRTLRLNGEPYEVIGVMPESFRFVQAGHALWTPIQFNDLDQGRSAHSFFAAARIKDDVPFETAEAEIREIGRRLAEIHPQNRGEGVTITRMDALGVEPLQPTLVALTATVAFVLLIACVNVANLMLAQTASRRREFAICAALGAGRGRLATQLLAEGLLLAVAGGAVGALVALLGTAALAESLPPAIRFAPFRSAGSVPLDARVLGFTSAIAVVAGILFSVAPMFGAARINPGATLRASADRGGTIRLPGLRQGLVAVEIALAVVVLFAAGLMIKSVARLVAVDPGLDKTNVLLMDIALPQPDFYGPPERTTFCADMQRELASLPGVTSVGAISHLPLSGANAGRGLTIEGRPTPAPGEEWNASYRLTCPGYFASLGIPVVRGRDFTEHDSTSSSPVVIINEETARRYFAGQDPIGQRLTLGGPQSSNPWLTIVGVVRDVRHFGLENPIRREIFRPYSQAAWPSMTITIKTAVEPLTLVTAAKAALSRIDSEQPVSRPRTMESVVAESTDGRRFPMVLLSLFSAAALVLSAIGVYGVVSYLVSQRTREMGIRIALGARRPQVIRLVVGGSLRPVASGVAIGIAGAILSARLLSTLLYAVTPSDPSVLLGIVTVLGTTAAVACWVPARRAANVDPIVALRDE